MFGMFTPLSGSGGKTVKLVQESKLPSDWWESPVDNGMRDNLRAHDTFAMKRNLFPLSARLLKDAVGMKQGVVLVFARVRLEPSQFPIEAWHCEGNTIRKTSLRSDEAEIIPPVPLSALQD